MAISVRTYATRDGGGGGALQSQKSQNISYTFILFQKNPPKVRVDLKNSLLFRKNEMPLSRKPQNIHHFLSRQPVQFSIKTQKSFLYEGPFLTKSAWVSSKVVFILRVLTIMSSKHQKSLKNHIFKCSLGHRL